MAADDALPPVEPPSAGFILQLFVVPGVIVAVIVLVFLTFTWLARKSDPQKYIAALQRPGPGRWQAAATLADVLRDGRYEEFRRDEDACRALAAMLQEEIRRGDEEVGRSENAIKLRQFLCRVLGEFHIDAGLAALIEAATTVRYPAELDVQCWALDGLCVLAGSSEQGPQVLSPEDRDRLTDVLLDLAGDQHAPVRYRVAYGLGVVGGDRAAQRLEAMLADPNPDVRYNAAAGLARHGREAATEVLLEMLQPEQNLALELELDRQMRPHKRAMILVSGMQSTLRLHKLNPDADIDELVAAIEKLADSDLQRPIRLAAVDAHRRLTSSATANSSSTAP